jgi:molybdenum cofactor sulfurtransferase
MINQTFSLQEKGEPIPPSRVAAHATANSITLRTGCMCNPGGAATLLSLGSLMTVLGQRDAHHPPTLRSLEEAAGRELGVVRISFGLASCRSNICTSAHVKRINGGKTA